MMKRFIKKCARHFGYDIVRYRRENEFACLPLDLTEDEIEILISVLPFTMTCVDRIVCLIRATKYIIENRIDGDFVECGVWRGGSMMVVAKTLKLMGDTTRKLYLYDTFAGMSQPTEKDIRFDGTSAHDLIRTVYKDVGTWCYAAKNEVAKNLLSTGYPESNLVLIEGKVEQTIPQTVPAQICLLRLDTDWYQSTKHELTHLYPNLVQNGVLIIDDYGHWQGAKQAADEYFNQYPIKPFLQRVSYDCRVVVKPEV
jgi:O-methyltransferase